MGENNLMSFRKGPSMNDTALFTRLLLPNAALAFDLDALYTCLQEVGPGHM